MDQALVSAVADYTGFIYPASEDRLLKGKLVFFFASETGKRKGRLRVSNRHGVTIAQGAWPKIGKTPIVQACTLLLNVRAET